MHERNYESSTVFEDLQGGVELEITGGPVRLEYELKQLNVVKHMVTIKDQQVISMKEIMVY